MSMTMTQKILAAHSGREKVKAGEFIDVRLDIVLANDITGPVAIKEFIKMGATEVFDTKKIALVPDHFTPNKDIKAAQMSKELRDFARDKQIENYFEIGQMGIEHVILPEKGLVQAGDVVIGADSHTCTYGALGAFATGVGSTDMAAGMATGRAWLKVPEAIKFVLKNKPSKWVGGKDIILHIIGMIGVDGALYKSMEFVGSGIKYLTMDDRFTMANMAIEAGAKNGIFLCDDLAKKYIESKNKSKDKEPAIYYEPDDDATYERTIVLDLGDIRPTVAFPHLPDNTRTIDEIGDIKIDQVVIGSCTNGRLEDMKIAASILKTGKVHRRVRCIVFPGSQEVYMDCIRNGFAETFIKAGAIISTPTCGPCIGGHMGILAEGERAVSTTNRNFVGRMGHITSEIYLASPAVAAASALAGKLANPEHIKIKEEK